MNRGPGLPKEHGVWAMLGYPFLIAGLLAARSAWPPVGAGALDWLRLIAGSALAYAGFSSLRTALRQTRARAGALDARRPGAWIPPSAWRHPASVWGVLLGVVALAVAWPLFLPEAARPLCYLAGVGGLAVLVNLVIVRVGEERGVAGEFVGMLTISLVLPAALLLVFGAWQPGFTTLWLFVYLFNASSIFYVRLRREMLRADAQADALRAARRRLAVWIVLSALVVAGLIVIGAPRGSAGFALLPLWFMSAVGARHRGLHPSVTALGFALLGQALLFSLILGFLA